MDQLYCLRCPTEPLKRIEPHHEGIAFFECLACRRHYALRPGKELTYRVGPVGVALYGAIFDESPAEAEKVLRTAASLRQGRSDDELAALVKEIRLELNNPTQQVRDILDCRATEQQLRLFLGLLCDKIETIAPSAMR